MINLIKNVVWNNHKLFWYNEICQISYVSIKRLLTYELTTSVRFWLSFDCFKWDFIAIKADIISIEIIMFLRTASWRYAPVSKCYLTCSHTIFMTWHYSLLNNSDAFFTVPVFKSTQTTEQIYYRMTSLLKSLVVVWLVIFPLIIAEVYIRNPRIIKEEELKTVLWLPILEYRARFLSNRRSIILSGGEDRKWRRQEMSLRSGKSNFCHP